MFWSVQSFGCKFRSMAAFSAGNPKASKPIGYITFRPVILKYRDKISGTEKAYQCPICKLPEG